MKTKSFISVFSNVIGRSALSIYSYQQQFISNFLSYNTNTLELRSHRLCSTFSEIAKDKLLERPEVQSYLKLVSDEYDKVDVRENCQSPILDICRQIKKFKDDLKNLTTLNPENDKDLQSLIRTEEENFKNEIKRLSGELIIHAVPECNDKKSVIFSVIPGLGGQEAKLFAEELFYMYLNYARYRNWEILHIDKLTVDGGGVSRAEATISGESVFKYLRHEAGIHRVQRVPSTEKNGKVQTSTCKINVIPEVEADEILLSHKDLKFETKTSSAPGGQNVNKVESCVRVTYIPTGLTVECQSERLQSANKTMALKKLKNLLYQKQQEKISSEIKDIKSEQAVTVKRSEKIRTYNFMQNRVTDHRINYTTHHIEKYMEGNKLLDDMVLQMEANYQEEYIIRHLKKIVQKKNINELFQRKGDM